MRASLLDDPESFLEIASEYHLGGLMTEAQHPDTLELSRLAKGDLSSAIATLKQVDLGALGKLKELSPSLLPMAQEIHHTLEGGHRIFLCGCGATGRLSLSLEIFARSGQLGDSLPDGAVLGFMAGGDAALIRSIESFEDFPDYGARQLMELGFTPGDLLIATTEGGETPFVIGATEAAAGMQDSSARAPYFLYCNPDEILCRVAERSRKVIESPAIRSISLPVGPMGLSGSTRMQASTVLMAAVGWAICHRNDPKSIPLEVEKFITQIEAVDFFFLKDFIEMENFAYASGQRVLYQPSTQYGITVLTDTTERAPTFSLVPFENTLAPGDLEALCYLHLQGTRNTAEAWQRLLQREPRTLEWEGVAHLAGRKRLLGFDFSDRGVRSLLSNHDSGGYLRFEIEGSRSGLLLALGESLDHIIPVTEMTPFSRQLLLKLLLNIHSTLVMGRLGRYEDNLMTYVSPANNKLIDRAVRYVELLLRRRLPEGTKMPDYGTLCRELFRQKAVLPPGESVVLRTLSAFLPEDK
jgi:N-acetylmuramic acid 6-phosphate etherase